MDFPQRVNGWALYAHPCFQETYDALVAEVETLKGKDPENYQRKAATKLLAVVHKVIEEHITVGNDSNLLIVFYVQIMPDDFVMQLHR
ncbi:type II toxin-antitoxin system YhaV family toxin, partial [Escherichia coli]|uniref:type II toxin-antitoxin system YhaV family toxin n=1 Tax=Escherichia coli TaxID=562 RepID=UPI00201CE1AB